MIKNLPKWALTSRNPAFYDIDSLTAVEQTANLYAKIQELIDIYNAYEIQMNNEYKVFKESYEKDMTCFKNNIIKICNDYIEMLDTKINNQDAVIDDAVKYMKDNLMATITSIIETMKENGELDTSILNAFDNLGTRVNNLENGITTLGTRTNSLETREDNLETRLTSIESNPVAMHYDTENETLTFINIEEE